MHSATVGLCTDVESVYVFNVIRVLNSVYVNCFFFLKDMHCVYCEVERVI
jgi:hypothetical protein